MGFLKDTFSGLAYLSKEITGVNALNKAKEEYNEIVTNFTDKVRALNYNISRLNSLVSEINREKQECVNLINLYGLIDKKNKQIDLSEYEKILDENKYNIAKIASGSAIGGSLIIGGILSAGTYTLASVFGTASTGTAIASLSGAAATNATLATIGGGALAAGGGGIAAGTSALGVIAIAPVALYAFHNYTKVSDCQKKIKEIAEDMKIIEKKLEIVKKAVQDNSDLRNRIAEEKNIYNKKMSVIVKKANMTTKEFVEKLRALTQIFNGNIAIENNENKE